MAHTYVNDEEEEKNRCMFQSLMSCCGGSSTVTFSPLCPNLPCFGTRLVPALKYLMMSCS